MADRPSPGRGCPRRAQRAASKGRYPTSPLAPTGERPTLGPHSSGGGSPGAWGSAPAGRTYRGGRPFGSAPAGRTYRGGRPFGSTPAAGTPRAAARGGGARGAAGPAGPAPRGCPPPPRWQAPTAGTLRAVPTGTLSQARGV